MEISPESERLEKFWKRCGFTWQFAWQWIYPDRQFHSYLPELTLDNLFKYAVSKLLESARCGISLQGTKDGWDCHILVETHPYIAVEAYKNKPELALFEALEKAIVNDATIKLAKRGHKLINEDNRLLEVKE